MHAFPDVAADGPWTAVCGERAHPADVDVVEAFAGAPCVVCALSAATVSAAPAVPREELDGPPVELDSLPELPGEPAGPVPDEALFALSWRERTIHHVAADAPRVVLQGRTLVLGVCGVLGWGPLPSAPSGWLRCAECERAAGAEA